MINILVKLLAKIGIIKAVEIEMSDDEWNAVTSQLDAARSEEELEKVLGKLVAQSQGESNSKQKWSMSA